MKKNILIIVLSLISVSSFVYAFIKADEAEKAAIEASLAQQEAERLQEMALVIQVRAQEAAAEAKRQQELALQAVRDCQNK